MPGYYGCFSSCSVYIRNHAFVLDIICSGWIDDRSKVSVEMSVRVSHGPGDSGERMKLIKCRAS